MYHAACKVEFQPFKRSYSQLTFFNFSTWFVTINTAAAVLDYRKKKKTHESKLENTREAETMWMHDVCLPVNYTWSSGGRCGGVVVVGGGGGGGDDETSDSLILRYLLLSTSTPYVRGTTT